MSLATSAAGQRDTSRAGARPLPEIVARAERELCPNRDDPRARALWEQAREHYDQALDSASIWARMNASSGYVRAPGLLTFDTVPSNRADGTTDGWNTGETRRDSLQRPLAFYEAARVGAGRRGMAGRLRASLSRGIAREGYAALNRGVSADLTQVTAVWTYPPLDGELASHFISDLFGTRTFFRIDREERPTTLAFCSAPRFRSQPYISGTFYLRADLSLERVQWHFHTPEPQEDAGGEVRFAALRPGVRETLTPAQGEVYRRHAGDLFYHRRLVYTDWAVTPAPLLPDSLLAPQAPPRAAHVRFVPWNPASRP